MTKLKTILLAAAMAAPALVAGATAQAQVNGVAIADPQAAIGGTRAWQTARTQIQTTYKAQLDQADARGKAIQAELTPLVTAFRTAQAAPNANQAALQQQYQNIQARQQAGQQELARIAEPAERAQAYAIEQIQAQLSTAVQNVVRQKNVSLLLQPQAALFSQPTADITQAISTELDRLVPTVSVTPPAGWQPGQQGQPGQAAARPATTAPAATPRRNTSGR